MIVLYCLPPSCPCWFIPSHFFVSSLVPHLFLQFFLHIFLYFPFYLVLNSLSLIFSFCFLFLFSFICTLSSLVKRPQSHLPSFHYFYGYPLLIYHVLDSFLHPGCPSLSRLFLNRISSLPSSFAYALFCVLFVQYTLLFYQAPFYLQFFSFLFVGCTFTFFILLFQFVYSHLLFSAVSLSVFKTLNIRGFGNSFRPC